MRELNLEPVPVSDALKAALTSAGLLTDDLEGADRAYFALVDSDGGIVGYSGFETCDEASVLLRSVVVVPEFRSNGLGRRLVELTLAKLPIAAEVYLATTSAAPFFESFGFTPIQRDQAPNAILSTRQLSGLCPASATIMRLNRPPT
ncbi:N-acetylglutamate synthase-like GNAT family acetyltransferase [Rhizobium aethiopicum]|uniref:N-acetylglutamate synthase-like GNAT family acetyltransferase n=1 Tax=Rhizobium aethiopicum TaxID=1138170 RepID=A0A7W6MDV4_9HYPH|nr:arsenic resistance N-acetyltransferase ArsN2 [Rhizobium aethiopicum]MBB4190032.1 N-acetylglutamate synthase-like GNAT family acetyltransferase [Rhizobium aethiopicum]MBB4580229.1 N-acetylglutamate synthase-like GNAT family acetyltransferase [Rhizobium aethiopicum]